MSQTVLNSLIETAVPMVVGGYRQCETFRMGASFWTQFIERYWHIQPTLIKSPFKQALISEQEAFDTLWRASEDYKSLRRGSIKVFVGSGHQMCDVDELLPRMDDGSIIQYSKRLADVVSERDTCLVFERVQLHNAELWMRARHFLAGLYEQVGLPGLAADLDFFFGKYSRTPTGIHTDEIANFSYVVCGTKKMLLWPHAAFEHLVPPDATGLHTVRYEQFLDSAITLEGQAGDLMFWPASYWHIGVSEGGWHLTVNLSSYLNKPFMQSLRQVLMTNEFSAWLNSMRESMAWVPCNPGSESVVPRRISQEAKLVRELAGDPRVGEMMEDLWFRKASASGFETVPPPLPVPTLHDHCFVSGEPHFPILMVPGAQGKCRVFSNGNVLRVPSDGAMSRLISRLNSGLEFRVGDLIKECVEQLGEHARTSRVQQLRRTIELLCSFRSVAWRENRGLHCE